MQVGDLHISVYIYVESIYICREASISVYIYVERGGVNASRRLRHLYLHIYM